MKSRKELDTVTTIQTIKCDAKTTVGEALATVIRAWKEIPKSGQIKITYSRKTPAPKTTRHSTTLSYLFDVDFTSRKSILTLTVFLTCFNPFQVPSKIPHIGFQSQWRIF